MISGPARRGDRDPELPLDPDAPTRSLHFRAGALAAVFVGGVIGTLTREGLAVLAPTETGRWPWGTFAANLAGCLVLGVLLEVLGRVGTDDGLRRVARLLIGTGFCGGLTTYSTYAVEIDLLTRDGHAGLALGYLAASLAAGLTLVVAGITVAARWHGRVTSR